MTIDELATKVIRLLDMQAEYFRGRAPSVLSECKDAERRLRRECVDVLNPPAADLFDGGEP